MKCALLRMIGRVKMRRKKLGKGGRYFSRTASATHYKNVKPRPMRGGIRS